MGRGEVRVVLLGHASVRMAQRGCDHLQRHASFGEQTRVTVAEDVERDGRSDLRVQAGLAHRAVLVRRPPGRAIVKQLRSSMSPAQAG